jgi:hypothetical protein
VCKYFASYQGYRNYTWHFIWYAKDSCAIIIHIHTHTHTHKIVQYFSSQHLSALLTPSLEVLTISPYVWELLKDGRVLPKHVGEQKNAPFWKSFETLFGLVTENKQQRMPQWTFGFHNDWMRSYRLLRKGSTPWN